MTATRIKPQFCDVFTRKLPAKFLLRHAHCSSVDVHQERHRAPESDEAVAWSETPVRTANKQVEGEAGCTNMGVHMCFKYISVGLFLAVRQEEMLTQTTGKGVRRTCHAAFSIHSCNPSCDCMFCQSHRYNTEEQNMIRLWVRESKMKMHSTRQVPYIALRCKNPPPRPWHAAPDRTHTQNKKPAQHPTPHLDMSAIGLWNACTYSHIECSLGTLARSTT